MPDTLLQLHARMLGDPETLRLLYDLQEEIDSRPVRTLPLPVVQLPKAIADSPDGKWVPEGCALFILSSPVENVALSLATALQEANLAKFREVLDSVEKLKPSFADRRKTAPNLTLVPNYYDVRYREKTLLSSAFITKDLPVRIEIFAYNGGILDEKQFMMLDHYRNEGPDRADAIMVLNPPKISEREKYALSSIPIALSGQNISGLSPLSRTVEAAAALIAATVVVATEEARERRAADREQQREREHEREREREHERERDVEHEQELRAARRGGDTSIRNPLTPTLQRIIESLDPTPTPSDLLKARKSYIQRFFE